MKLQNNNSGISILDNHKAAVRELDRKIGVYQKRYESYRAMATAKTVAEVLKDQNYRLVKSKNGFDEIRVGDGEHVVYAFNQYSAMNAIVAYPRYILNKLDHWVIFNPERYVPNARVLYDPSTMSHWFYSWNKVGFVPSVLNKDNAKLTERQLQHRTAIINKHRELETLRSAIEAGDSFGIVLYDEKMVAHWAEKQKYFESTLNDYLTAMAQKGEETRELEALENLPDNYQPAKVLSPESSQIVAEIEAKAVTGAKFSVQFSNKSGSKPAYRHVTDGTSLKEALRCVKAAPATVTVEIVDYCAK